MTITDLTPTGGDPAFLEAMRKAEEAAGVPSEPEELVDAVQEDPAERVERVERARDEHGRFAKAEDAEAENPPDVEVSAEPMPPEPERPAWLPPQFKNEEEFARSWAEQQSHIGRLGDELGQLRQVLEAPQAQPQPQPYVDWQGLIETNPGQAAQLAYEQGNTGAMNAAWQTWAEENPAAAASWRNDRVLEQHTQAYEKRIEALTAALEERIAPITSMAHENALTTAVTTSWQQIAPEFGNIEFPATAVQQAAENAPELAQTLANPAASHEDRVRSMRALVKLGMALSGDNLAKAKQVQARDAAAAADRAKQDASVAQTTNANPGEQKLTPDEEARARDAALLDNRAGTLERGGFVWPPQHG